MILGFSLLFKAGRKYAVKTATVRTKINLMGQREDKVKKTFRYSKKVAQMLEEIAKEFGQTENTVSAEAIIAYYQSMKGNKSVASLVEYNSLFSEYRKLQEKVEQLQYALGKLEVRVKVQDETITTLRRQLNEKERRIVELQETLQNEEKQIKALEESLKSKENYIKKLQEELEKRGKPWWKF